MINMKIKFCPKCFSQKFEEVFEGKIPGQPLHYAAQTFFRCKNCGFTSITFPEVETQEELGKIKDNL